MAGRPRFFYGYTLLFICVISMILVYGVRNSFNVFFPPILEEFGWSRSSTAFIFSLNVLVYGLMAPVAGNLADRWRPKALVTGGVLILAAGTVGCASATQLWHFYILYGLVVPVGIALGGTPVLIPAVSNWFEKKRAMTMGIGLAGGGLSFSVSMYAEVLISAFGWRYAYVIMGGTIALIIFPLLFLFFQYRPKTPVKTGRREDEAGIAVSGGNIPVNVGEFFGSGTLSQIIRNYRLWLLMVAFMLNFGIANYLIVSHHVIYAQDLGYSSAFAASVAGLVGFSIALGNISAFVSDRIGRENMNTFATVLSVFSLVILLLQNDTSHPWAMYIFAVCFGLGVGLNIPNVTAGAADLFRGKQFGTVNGLLLMGFGLGGAIGPWLGGYIYDTSGSYATAFIICMVCYCLACLAVWVAAPRKAVKAGVGIR